MPSNTGRGWRLGLLVTTLAMGAALVTSGIDRYLSALDSSRAVTEAEVFSMLVGAKREIARSREDHEEIVASIYQEMSERGVSYLALIGDQGEVIHELGTAREAIDVPADLVRRRAGPPQIIPAGDGEVVHAFIVVGRRHGLVRTGKRPRVALMLELIPERAHAIVASALRALAVEIGAALVLLALAVVFWRFSRRAELLAAQVERERIETAMQLERDRHLKSLGQMSAVLGHELRNPLTALKGHAQLLLEKLDGNGDNDLARQARTIADEAHQLETLSQQVLDFARTGELDIAPVYVDDLAHAAITFGEVGPVELDVPDGLPPWPLDRQRMEQVLTNLLVNARQASPAGAPIAFAAHVTGAALVIEVRDRGPGISAGDEHKIFEPFYTTRAQGSGLGLALAQRIVEGHGGTIEAFNRDGAGAVFRLTIPIRAPEEQGHG